MDDKKTTKNNKIKEIFETMEYGNDKEDTTEATEWLKDKNLFAYIDNRSEAPNGEAFHLKNFTNDEDLCNIYTPENATIDNILKKQGSAKNTWLEVPPTKKARLIYKLGAEIQKQQRLFIQLEAVARGVLSKDTKKVLPLLTDYLQYYSGFSIKLNSENPSWKPEGLAVGIFSENNSLASLGCFLGPCLASGYQVILQTAPQLSVVAAFLIDLAIKVGIPEDTIRLIPGPAMAEVFFTHANVSTVAVFDDLHNEKYFIGNHFNKKILNFYSPGIPMLLFDGADLDSACQSLVDAAWGYKGMLPWSVRQVYVQENIFDIFVHKIKQRVDKILVAKSDKKNADISWPNPEVLDKLKTVIAKAKNEGANVYQSDPNNPTPTLFIGDNIFTNNVIKEDSTNIPIVTLAAFRTINEAVALANNSRQGLAASVWTESTSLANEIIGKLKVANIWINSHGLFSADIAFAPYKTSGNAYFGGKEGFYEYVSFKSLKNNHVSQTQNSEMEKAINEAKKGQESWHKLPRLERIKALQLLAQEIDASTTNKWAGLNEKWLQDWVVSIYDYTLQDRGDSFSTIKGFNVSSKREACGILAIEALEDLESHNKKLIIAALSEGNSVILLLDDSKANNFYSSFSKLLPKGVFTAFESSQEATKTAALHKELNVYFGEKCNSVFLSLPLKSSSKFTMALDNWDHVKDKVTLTKVVWWNVGQTFI